MRFDQPIPVVFLYFETLLSIIRTGQLFLVELIDLARSAITFLLYLKRPYSVSQLQNSDHVVSVSICFPSNSKGNVHFYCTAYDYSGANLDGLICYYLGDVLWNNTLENLSLLLRLPNFMGGSRLELMCIFLVVNIRSNLIHLHDF